MRILEEGLVALLAARLHVMVLVETAAERPDQARFRMMASKMTVREAAGEE